MKKVPQEHPLASGRKFSLLHGVAVFAVVLMCSISMEAHAQDENEACPCFSYEEVKAIFLMGEQLSEEEGISECRTEDYSVECNAEVVILDQDYTTIAQASVNWFDFDPSRCNYIDTVGNPGVERSISWPHPAPEAIARACYKIISRVIKELDASGKCATYP